MARDPGSVWAPLPEAGAPDGHVKTQFIVHSTGDNGTAAGTRRYFEGVTPNESTFIIGQGPWDPTLQIMDSTDRADANMSASVRAISVEVVGDGKSGYNAWQRSEIIRIGRWARREHGIPARVIPSEPAGGFGWHVMFGAPGPWAGVAKSCPGGQRIAELQADIFPAIFATDQEDDMPSAQEIAAAVWGYQLKHAGVDASAIVVAADTLTVAQQGAPKLDVLVATAQQVAGLQAAVNTLAGAVASGRDDLTAEELRTVIREEMANVVDVQVTVRDGNPAA